MLKRMKLGCLFILSTTLIFIACGSDSDGFFLDANGPHDMTEAEVFTLLPAIGLECQDEALANKNCEARCCQ